MTDLRELKALSSLWERFVGAKPRWEGQTGRLQQNCVRRLKGNTALLKTVKKNVLYVDLYL